MSRMLLLLVAVWPLLAARPVFSQIETATVTGGKVKGVVQDRVASFKGIPFAAPPVGDLRWKAPQAVVPWEGVRMADAFAAGPMQNKDLAARLMGNTGPLSEDCLYLNVWTAARDAHERRPVMVWIYGGAFITGMSSLPMYDGRHLAERGVVLVSLAYRVGPFGFLAHPDLSKESGHGSGCYGLQDQVAALRWVQENIAQFGGDPNNVTIFGESAGGISVNMLTIVPAARGLFQRAISESGGSMTPIKTGNEAGEHVVSLVSAEKTGADFFKKLGVSDLKSARAASAEAVQNAVGSLFWPVPDGATLPGDAYWLYEAGKYNDTPVLAGINSDEGALFVHGEVSPENFEQQIRRHYGPAAEGILKAYPHATPAEAFKAAKDVFRETEFAWNTWTWANEERRKGTNKMYLYYFDRRSASAHDGSSHAAEMEFVFHNLGIFFSTREPDDVALSTLMGSYWVNFATTGNPNGPGLPAWPAFDDQETVNIFSGGSATTGPLPDREQIRAFDAYYQWRRGQETNGLPAR